MDIHIDSNKLELQLSNLIDMRAGISYGMALCEKYAKQFCPVDTGNLRASISTRMENNKGIVYTNVEYAPYVEYGTAKQSAQPFMQRAVIVAKPMIIARFVNKGGK